jgi:hypothetical protein
MTYRARCRGRKRRLRLVWAKRYVRSLKRPPKPRRRTVDGDAFFAEQHALGTQSGDGWFGSISGAAPVQGEGEVDGVGWYFRARGNGWSWETTSFDENGDLALLPDGTTVVEYGGTYGREAYDASYMPTKHAWALIKNCINRYRQAVGTR